MRVADGDSQCIGGIRPGAVRKMKYRLHHHLHLILLRKTVSHNRLFDLKGRIFENWNSLPRTGKDGNTAHMPLLDQAPDILPEKDIFDGNGVRPGLFGDVGNAVIERLKAF